MRDVVSTMMARVVGVAMYAEFERFQKEVR